MTHPERIVPDETDPGIVALHTKRYEFALAHCSGRRVLDAACGVGYGSAILAEHAAEVVGVDISPDAVAYARRTYPRPHLQFAVMDVTRLDLDVSSFDVVCSFETIEHVAEPERAVAEAARVLRPEGVYVVSTPRADETTRSPANPFHEVELSVRDFTDLLASHFESVDLYGQRRLVTKRHQLMQRLDLLGLRRRIPALRRAAPILGTRPMESLTSEDVTIDADRLDEASELVAVCRLPRS